MQFQTVNDNTIREAVFRIVYNSNTSTGTITAGSIARLSPVVIETNSASWPSTAANSSKPFYPSTNGHNWCNRPATSTSLVNNLLLGILVKVPGTKAYLDREEQGLVQCYGAMADAIVQIPTSTINPGAVLTPESLQMLILATGPMTAAATSSSAHTEAPAIGGLIYAIASIASSSATATTNSPVFIRCM